MEVTRTMICIVIKNQFEITSYLRRDIIEDPRYHNHRNSNAHAAIIRTILMILRMMAMNGIMIQIDGREFHERLALEELIRQMTFPMRNFTTIDRIRGEICASIATNALPNEENFVQVHPDMVIMSRTIKIVQ
jgi:hypothetical protein